MANKDWKLIAASLGLIIPMSLAAGEVPTKTNLNLGENTSSVITNQVRDRIMSFQQTSPQASNEMFPVHTNTHSDAGGSHVNSHSDTPHANSHTDRTNPNTCPVTHTNIHNDRGGNNSHTDYGGSHTNKHTDRDC